MKKTTTTLFCAWLALAGMAPAAFAFDAAAVPAVKQTKSGRYLDAKEAYALKQQLGDKAYFVDVRTRAEVSYLGMPTVADANIPYVEHPDDAQWDEKNHRFRLEPNNDFAPELERRMKAHGLGRDDTVILICRSGDRSARAANLLSDLGYSRVYTVVDGYEGDMSKEGQRTVNGWKNAHLPWSYQLDKEKMYFPKF